MHAQQSLTVMLAALFALACAPAATPQQAAGAPAGAVSDEASAAPTAAALVGRWGDNGDCTKDVVLSADGTFTSYAGGAGRWSLNGDRLVMSGADGVFELRISSVNESTLIVGNPDGSFGISQRC
jgi:hypothetical protein